jgi:hypothetical protein
MIEDTNSHIAGTTDFHAEIEREIGTFNQGKSNSCPDKASERWAVHPRAPNGQVAALVAAAKANRQGHREATMILRTSWRHHRGAG